jgi:molybdopterin synthase sulfur carrier subunit
VPDVRLPTLLRPHAGGQGTVHANGDTVAGVFEDLVRQFPNLGGRIVADDGNLHRFVNVYVNDEDIRYKDGLSTEVGSGDVVAVVPAVAGGAGN